MSKPSGIIVFRSQYEFKVFNLILSDSPTYSLIGTVNRTQGNNKKLTVTDNNDTTIPSNDSLESLEDALKLLNVTQYTLCLYSKEDLDDWLNTNLNKIFTNLNLKSIQNIYNQYILETQSPLKTRVKLSIVESKNEQNENEEMIFVERFTDIMQLDPYKDKADDTVLNRAYGFGSFILNLKFDQIEYDNKVIDFLSGCIGKRYSSMGDLFGFSFEESKEANDPIFHNPKITYASLGKTLMIPLADCTVSREVFYKLQEHLKESIS